MPGLGPRTDGQGQPGSWPHSLAVAPAPALPIPHPAVFPGDTTRPAAILTLPVDITRPLVEKVALLARLEIPPAGADKAAAQLGRIVTMVEKLNELDTKNVEPMTNPTGLVDAFRSDEPRPSLPRAEALANAPDKVEMFLRVPRVVE